MNIKNEDSLRLEAESWFDDADKEDVIDLYLEWTELIEHRDQLLLELEDVKRTKQLITTYSHHPDYAYDDNLDAMERLPLINNIRWTQWASTRTSGFVVPTETIIRQTERDAQEIVDGGFSDTSETARDIQDYQCSVRIDNARYSPRNDLSFLDESQRESMIAILENDLKGVVTDYNNTAYNHYMMGGGSE